MSEAKVSFEYGIKDAEDLLDHFDSINTKPPPENAEVLKRAGLVMALTAWETYVEDRVTEDLAKKLSAVSGSYAGNFIENRLRLELKQFNTPSADKTKKLFLDYLDIDVTQGWKWANTDPGKAKKNLNEWISKRGDAVHRSKPVSNGSPLPHLIKRDELVKAIRFIKDLVNATEVYLNENI
ncbi:HEPN domain-containing protein [Thiorhodococcus fuscus]|uniref:HEPN domain-containing protein n=1 Tax=Thiorhodococcus fuscus TaxID=527200 RepID=A0ABW4Y9E1_9GAMM